MSDEDAPGVGVGQGSGVDTMSTGQRGRGGLVRKCCPWLCPGPAGEGKRCRPKCHWWKSACARMFLVVVNLSFLIAGCAMVILGIWMHLHQDSYFFSFLLKTNPTNPVVVFDSVPFVLIGVGLFLAAMSFLGCCGACTDSICFLSFYTILLVIVVLTEIVFGIFSLVVKDELSRQLLASLQYQVKNEYNKTALPVNLTALDVNEITQAWDTLQTRMNCCGAIGPQDYFNSEWFNKTRETAGMFVPPTCCLLLNSNPKPLVLLVSENHCQVEAIMFPKHRNESLGYLKTTGCHPVVMDWVYAYEWNVGCIIAIHVFIQAACFILGCVLMTWVRKKHADYWWCDDEEYE